MTARPGLRELFDDLAGEVRPVDLTDRVSRTAKVIRRRRVAGGSTAVAVVVAAGALTASSLTGTSSLPVKPGLATPAPVTHPPLVAVTPSAAPQASATVTAPSAKGPASWRIGYLLTGPSNGAEVRDGTGRLVHAFPAGDRAFGGNSLDLVTLSPDGSILAYTLNTYGFDTLHVRRSDGSADPALDKAEVGPTTCQCQQQVLGGWQRNIADIAASPDDRHIATVDQYGLSIVTIGSRTQQTVVTLASSKPPKNGDGATVSAATWAADGRSLAFVTSGTKGRWAHAGGPVLQQNSLYVWDMTSDALTLVDKETSPAAIAWSSSGKLAWMTAKGTTKVRSGTTTQIVATAPKFNVSQQSGWLSWSPDGRRIAVSTDLLRLVTVSSGAATVVPQRGPDSKVLWLPDGNLLVTGFNAMNVSPATVLGGPMVFDQAGHLLRQFPWGKTNPYWDFSFGSPTG